MFSLYKYFKKPHFFKPNENKDIIYTRIPDNNIFNLFFIMRYFIRFFASFIPPIGFKSFLYSITGVNTGKNTFIGESVYFIDGFNDDLIFLEDESVLSPKVILVAMAQPGKSFLQYEYSVVKTGRIIIGKGAWIGAGAVILPGISIGKGAIVGANTVVTNNIPDYECWGGNPAKYIKSVKDFSKSDKKIE